MSAILELAPVRSYWLRDELQHIAAVYTVALVAKVVLVVLEELPKKVTSDGKAVDREMRAGIISRSVFAWLNRLFWTGVKTILSVHDLPDIGQKFSSNVLMDRLETAWAQCKSFSSYHDTHIVYSTASINSSRNSTQRFLTH